MNNLYNSDVLFSWYEINMKVYHFFEFVATGKEMGALGGDKLRLKAS